MTLRDWIAVVSSMLGAFISILDTQVTNSSLKDILGTLSATQEEGSWISTAYLVGEIVMIPLAAFCGRMFGVRAYLLFTTVLFLVFSTLCGMAGNLTSMIVFRMLQGFFGGGLIPISMTLVVLKLPQSKRAIGMGMFGLTATLAPTLGPTFGGYLSESYGWPSIFFLNWAPGVLLIAGISYGLDGETIKWNLLRDGDWISIAFMALGLGSLVLVLEEGNLKDWFESDFIVAFTGLAICGLCAWVLRNNFSQTPFVNLGLFLQRNFLVASILSAVMGVALYGSNFLVPLFLTHIAEYTPMQIGEVLLWAGLPQIIVMLFAARLSTQIDNRIICSVGLALFGISCIMNAQMDATTGYDQLLYSQVVRALGQPLIMLTISNFSMQGIGSQDVSSASSLSNMIRGLGGSMGIALLATTLTNREHFHSARIGESVSLDNVATQWRLEELTRWYAMHGVEPSTAAAQALETLNALVRREAFVMSYNDDFMIMGATLILCIIFLWFSDPVRAPSMGREVH